MGSTLVLKNSELSAAAGVEPEDAWSAGSTVPSLAPEYRLFTAAAKNTSSRVALLVPIILKHPSLHNKTAQLWFTCCAVRVGNCLAARVEAPGCPSRYRVQARARSRPSRFWRRGRGSSSRAPSLPPRRESSDSPECHAHARHAR